MVQSSIQDPSVVILASRYDLSSDHVVSRLRGRGVSYLRLNSEDLPDLRLNMDPVRGTVEGEKTGEFSFVVRTHTVRGIYYRRPVFLRPCGSADQPPEDLLAKEQWQTFIRAFMAFDGCRWMNHPAATYRAENKPVQLGLAQKVGFAVPKTLITNQASKLTNVAGQGKVAIKGLDTILLRDRNTERFGYTVMTSLEEVRPEDVSSFPVIAQEPLNGKTDLRVTVVGEEVFCVSITDKGKPIDGDWRRKRKELLSFEYHRPPDTVKSHCIELTKHLGLAFGAIDLAVMQDVYYFLEINPTGEWAWLLHNPGMPIDDSIARYFA